MVRQRHIKTKKFEIEDIDWDCVRLEPLILGRVSGDEACRDMRRAHITCQTCKHKWDAREGAGRRFKQRYRLVKHGERPRDLGK